jgi:hypothetical protein
LKLHNKSAVTYEEANNRRIYAFVRGDNGHLHVRYWNGSQWKWADQGTPPGTTLSDAPGVITYAADKQRIYAFARGGNGHLFVNYWNGSQWKWADQGTPPGTTVAPDSSPGVITYAADKQRIYAFARGGNGHLFVNYWDGSQWKWADQGTPPGTTVIPKSSPGVITYEEADKRKIYAFVQGNNGRLYVNYWDGSQWKWADQGEPIFHAISPFCSPGVITYVEGGKRRIYAFVTTDDNSDITPLTLDVNYWNGSQWKWANQGTLVVGTPGVITYKEGDKQRIYAFVTGNGSLVVNYWDGSQWKWANQGTPPGTKVTTKSSPGVITYLGANKQRIYAFVVGENGLLYVNYWDGSQWKWADQGTP